MNKIPIGNTLQVRWRVKHNGQAESLEGLDLSLVMTTPSGQKQAMAFAVSDTNLVTVNYEGKDQNHLGNYRLDLFENRGENNQRRIDSTPAFVLVAHTAEAHRESDPNLEVYTVDLTGDIEIDYPSTAVLFTPQELTDEQKAQARENIGVEDIEPCDIYVVDVNDAPSAEMISHTITKVNTDPDGRIFITFIPNSEIGLNKALYQYSDGWRVIETDGETQFNDFDTYGELFLWADEHSSPIATEDITDALELRVSNAEANINAVESIASSKQDRLVSGTNITIAADGKTISSPSELFFAEYNVTSFEDIAAAYNAGKSVFVKGDGDKDILPLVRIRQLSPQFAKFTRLEDTKNATYLLCEVIGSATRWSGEEETLATSTELSGKQDTISDLSDIRSGASAGATALQPSDIASWAKQPTKPTYTASEVGALPSSTEIPSKTSDLTNDSDYTTQAYVDGLVGNILTTLESI